MLTIWLLSPALIVHKRINTNRSWYAWLSVIQCDFSFIYNIIQFQFENRAHFWVGQSNKHHNVLSNMVVSWMSVLVLLNEQSTTCSVSYMPLPCKSSGTVKLYISRLHSVRKNRSKLALYYSDVLSHFIQCIRERQMLWTWPLECLNIMWFPIHYSNYSVCAIFYNYYFTMHTYKYSTNIM